ncbi:MAG: hypothetical protein MZW92_65250 [Comamonadaceae bacterium]|nr:hypothetical protein [Comamonadaceae bacterium]
MVGGTNFGDAGGNIIDITTAAATGSGRASTLGAGPEHRPAARLRRHLRARRAIARCLQTPDQRPTSSRTPNLITLDNEEAKIVVGENVPFVTGQYTDTGGARPIEPVPDHRAQGRRHHAAHPAADRRGRRGAA